jgi:hypothetical protein
VPSDNKKAPFASVLGMIKSRDSLDLQITSGSSSDRPQSVDSESSAHPDFEVLHRSAPKDHLPTEKNHKELSFFISKFPTVRDKKIAEQVILNANVQFVSGYLA